jgi:hypothetical protein
MKRTLIASLVASFSLVGPGCLVQTQERSQPSERQRSSQPDGERCRPSHDWDEKQQKCVHRGRGKGARKHDY